MLPLLASDRRSPPRYTTDSFRRFVCGHDMLDDRCVEGRLDLALSARNPHNLLCALNRLARRSGLRSAAFHRRSIPSGTRPEHRRNAQHMTCLCQAQTSAVSSSPGVFRSCPSDQGRSPALHTPSAPPQGRSPGRKRMPRRIKGRSPARKRMPRRITGRSPARERTPRRIPGRSPARERVKRHIMGRSPALKHWQPPLKSR